MIITVACRWFNYNKYIDSNSNTPIYSCVLNGKKSAVELMTPFLSLVHKIEV